MLIGLAHKVMKSGGPVLVFLWQFKYSLSASAIEDVHKAMHTPSIVSFFARLVEREEKIRREV